MHFGGQGAGEGQQRQGELDKGTQLQESNCKSIAVLTKEHMYLYTPKQQHLHHAKKNTTFGRKCLSWAYVQRILTEQNYAATVAFIYDYTGVKFYSKKKRAMIPVRGYLFDASLFDETFKEDL